MRKRVYVLGAGASIGHTSDVSPSVGGFFASAKRLGMQKQYDALGNYARKALGWQVWTEGKEYNIEDLFTHLEIEIERSGSSLLLRRREQLIDLIRHVLFSQKEKSSIATGEYNQLAQQLQQGQEKADSIITFNWDLLLDDILGRESALSSSSIPKKGLYHSFVYDLSARGEMTTKHLTMLEPYSGQRSEQGYYLKLHGSIDWFFCSNESCRAHEKVFPVFSPEKNWYCAECHELLQPLLVPPVLNKALRKYPLIRRIWNVAAQELAAASELLIWGYSLPPADYYSTWLLRQARRAKLQRVVIINPATFSRSGEPRKEFVGRFTGLLRGVGHSPKVLLARSYRDWETGNYTSYVDAKL